MHKVIWFVQYRKKKQKRYNRGNLYNNTSEHSENITFHVASSTF